MRPAPGARRAGRVAPLSASLALGAAVTIGLLGGGCSRAGTSDMAGGDAARGAAVFALAGGCGCHTPKEGPVGAGGVEIDTPLGTFYSSNITSDVRTGIGAWSDAELERAIRGGLLRDGSAEAPVMPYPAYAGMADQDLRDLIAYLRTLPAVARERRPDVVPLPLPRLAYRVWRLLFAGGGPAPAQAPAGGVERGRYLTAHVAICGDCHTPRNRLGVPSAALYLAGVAKAPQVAFAPNITPDPETGIGGWDADEVAHLLATGLKPDFDDVQGRMAEVVEGVGGAPGYARAPEADLRSIAAYLRTVPPIRHAVKRKQQEREEAP